MRLPSTFLNRLLSLALVGLFVLAVRLGRDEGEPRPQTGLGASPHRWAAGQEVLIDPQTRSYISLLNRETGRVGAIAPWRPAVLCLRGLLALAGRSGAEACRGPMAWPG